MLRSSETKRSTTKVVFLKSTIFNRFTWNLKRICKSGHWIQPPIIFEVNFSQKVNIGQISKVVNFHQIALKFEETLQIWSLNSNTNYFLGQICFMHLASVVLCMTSSSSSSLFVCLFVCLCARYLKKLCMYPTESLCTRWVCDKNKLIRFWLTCNLKWREINWHQLMWNLTITMECSWGIYVSHFNLSGRMFWQPELFNILNLCSGI